MLNRLFSALFVGILTIGLLAPPATAKVVRLDESQLRDYEAAEQAYQSGDYTTAAQLFLPLAEANYPDAQNYMGFLYEQGLGVDNDYAEAANWYRRAALQGHIQAQNHLGLLYYEGRGVLRDFRRAFIFFELSAAEGNEDAANNRLIVARKMTTEQITEAQKLAGAMLGELRAVEGGARPLRLASGVVITEQGHVLTHALAVRGCTDLTVRAAGTSRPATITAIDNFNGLAVVQTEDAMDGAVALRMYDVPVGEPLNVVGYRYNDAFVIERGMIGTAMAQVPAMDRLDDRYMPLDANLDGTILGAPVLDQAGALVAIIETGIKPESIAMIHGEMPDDMSFGIRYATAEPLLQMHGISVRQDADNAPMPPDAYDAMLEKIAVAVECWRGAT